jgi:hypothetical protein
MKKEITLYFIKGTVPTPEQLAEGNAIGARFRNADLVEGAPEACDFVAGNIPELYQDKPLHPSLANTAPTDEQAEAEAKAKAKAKAEAEAEAEAKAKAEAEAKNDARKRK